MYFSFEKFFVGILSILIFSVKNMGDLLKGQNLLSVTKLIRRQSLNLKNQVLHKSKLVSSNDPININRRQILLTGTFHLNS